MSVSIAILGAGRMGQVIALDLCLDYAVTVIERDPENLQALPDNKVEKQQVDLSQYKTYDQLLAPYDLVVNALPGALGFDTLRKCIEAGNNVVDLSFFPEDPFELEEQARSQEVTVIIDAGIAPGFSNLVAGHYAQQQEVEEFTCYVGGLPVERQWPLSYKAPFSPDDVLQEYIRPARVVENGEMIEKPALSDPEQLQFKEVGKLTAFLTDGLRTLTDTLDIPNMSEKTLRYPEHYEFIKGLRDTGFLSEEPLQEGEKMTPLDITSQILKPQWELGPEEEEFTLLYTRVKTTDDNTISLQLYDHPTDPGDFTSMGRTTGFTCTALVRYFLEEGVDKTGILPPELLAQETEVYPFVKSELEQKGVQITVSEDDHSSSISN